MNKQIKTTGIILRRIDFGEADQIITVLTKDEGKRSLLAKGSRRLKNKFCGKLELLYETELEYFQGQHMGHLNEAQSHCLVDEKTLDLKSRGLLFYISEVTNKLVAEEQENVAIYQLLKETLGHFEKDRAELVFYAYVTKLLTELGFLGEWDRCPQEHGKLNLNDVHYLDPKDASLSKTSGIKLDSSVIKWVNFMQKGEMEALKKIQASSHQKAEVSLVLKSVLGTILNSPVKSELFVAELNQVA